MPGVSRLRAPVIAVLRFSVFGVHGILGPGTVADSWAQLLISRLLAALVAVEGTRKLLKLAGQLSQSLESQRSRLRSSTFTSRPASLSAGDRLLPTWPLLFPGLGDDLPSGGEGDFFTGRGLLPCLARD